MASVSDDECGIRSANLLESRVTEAPGASGISVLVVRGALAARTPRVSSLTNASPLGGVTVSVRVLIADRRAVRPRLSAVRAPAAKSKLLSGVSVLRPSAVFNATL